MADDANVRPLPRRGRPQRPLSVSAAARRGEYELLVALRDRLAQAIGECQARDLAPLTRRLREIWSDPYSVYNARLAPRKAAQGGHTSRCEN